MWLMCIILWWIEIGMKNPNPPSTALFSFLRLSLKRQKSNYLHLFLKACLHGGVEPPGGWGNSPSCVRKIARVFFFFFLFLRRSLRDRKHQEVERRTFSFEDFLRSYRHNSFSVLLVDRAILKPSQQCSKVWEQAFFLLSLIILCSADNRNSVRLQSLLAITVKFL